MVKVPRSASKKLILFDSSKVMPFYLVADYPDTDLIVKWQNGKNQLSEIPNHSPNSAAIELFESAQFSRLLKV